MSKSGGVTKNISTTSPIATQAPYLGQLLSEAQRLYQQPGPSYFPGSTVAEFAPAEITARNYLSDYASGIAAPMAERAQQSLESNITQNPGLLDVGNNPLVQSVVRASTQDVIDQLNRGVLPSIRSGAQLAGQFGGTRQGLAEGLAIGEGAKAATNAAAGINLGAYNTGLDALQQGLALSPQIQQMGYTPADMLQAVGGQERALAQAKINEEIARWQYEQNLPYQKLAEYSNLVTQPMGGQSETYTTYPQTSGGQQIVGGIISLIPLITSLLRGIF